MIKVCFEKDITELAKQHYEKLIDNYNGFGLIRKFDKFKTKYIDKILDQEKKDYYITIFNYLKDKLEYIIISPPKDLEKIQGEISGFRNVNNIYYDEFITLIKDKNLFNYPSFSKINQKYNAYCLAKTLNITVCPYCNGEYTFVYKKRSRKFRHNFDHFYPKFEYPYFSLSFYNLIPSCSRCNNLKRNENFEIQKNLHPYVEGIDDSIRFDYKLISANFFENDINSIEIFLKKNISVNNSFIEKGCNNFNTFLITEYYNFFKDHVFEIIKKANMYSMSGLNNLLSMKDINGKKLFESKEEILRIILGTYLKQEDLNKRPLSKFVRDIAFTVDHFKDYIQQI